MAAEKQLWGWLACARRKMGPTLHINRIENLIESGTPDVELFVKMEPLPKGVIPQAWIELKSHERPAKPATPIRFPLVGREAQIHWLKTRWVMGGNAWFLLQIGSGAERRLYLAPGNMGNQLKAGMNEAQIAVACATHGGAVFSPNVNPETVLRKAITCRQEPFPPASRK